jgi:hypothetical protein
LIVPADPITGTISAYGSATPAEAIPLRRRLGTVLLKNPQKTRLGVTMALKRDKVLGASEGLSASSGVRENHFIITDPFLTITITFCRP